MPAISRNPSHIPSHGRIWFMTFACIICIYLLSLIILHEKIDTNAYSALKFRVNPIQQAQLHLRNVWQPGRNMETTTTPSTAKVNYASTDKLQTSKNVLLVSNIPTQSSMALVQEHVKTAHDTATNEDNPILNTQIDYVHSYDDMKKYLAQYDAKASTDTTKGILYVFFTCADANGNANNWSKECEVVTPRILSIFAQSPLTNRLLIVYTGPQSMWTARENDFQRDKNLYVTSIPAVLRYIGQGHTADMVVKSAALDEGFLQYIFGYAPSFQWRADQLLTLPEVKTKHILTVTRYQDFAANITEYMNSNEGISAPLYVHFVSSSIPENNIPWCQTCRESEIPTTVTFLSYAPKNSQLLRVEVASSLSGWENPGNSFRQDKFFKLATVPTLYRLAKLQDDEHRLRVEEMSGDALRPNLKSFFQGKGNILKTLMWEHPSYYALPNIEAPNTNAGISTMNENLDIVRTYDELIAYVTDFDKKTDELGLNENLFLYFTCSDDQGNQHDWESMCKYATPILHEVFARSPKHNRLLTIRAGTEKLWNTSNKFKQDYNFKLKFLPTLLKWEGHGKTLGMLVTDAIMEKSYLRYLFGNTDVQDPLLTNANNIDSKKISIISTHEAYEQVIETYREDPVKNDVFLMFVSGKLQKNNRAWCPYCRYSELPVTYSFYAYAKPYAKLIRIEVAQTYQFWKDDRNKFKMDSFLHLRGVPRLFRLAFDENSENVLLHRMDGTFDNREHLSQIFSGGGKVVEELVSVRKSND